MNFGIGQTVRYTRTGTVGKIISLANDGEYDFAELDTTGLLYRTDMLIAINETAKAESEKTDVRKDVIKEQEQLREMRETAWQNTDQSCEGGG